MKFQNESKTILLNGISNSTESAPVTKVTKKQQGVILQLIGSETKETNDTSIPTSIQQLLHRYEEVLAKPKGLPPHRNQDHRIPLQPGFGPVEIPPYHYPYFQKNERDRQVKEMLSLGNIHPSTSPYSSPVLLVKKHDGLWRMCVDYGALNKITIKENFPIPVIDELLDELAKVQYFTKLDLRSGYHQVRVHLEDVGKTDFQTHHGHYEFLVMPFRLTNAPSTFQALMNKVFQEFLRKFVLVFFNDIIIYSKNWGSHTEHLRIVFDILKANQLRVKLEKCQFGTKEVKYLGHVICSHGVVVDPSKVEAMLTWPKLKTPKALHGFLRLTGYYRKFIQNYGKIAAPLTNMLKNNSFDCSDKVGEAFQQLKMAMTQALVLSLPDFSKSFIVECDASRSGIGAVLL